MEHSEKKLNPLKRSFQAMNGGLDTDPDKKRLPPRDEMKVVKVALMRNTIAILDSGIDRAMLSLLMVQEFVKSFMEINVGKKIVILATTVNFVHQQYEAIKCHTKLQVQEFYGAKGIDAWDGKTWEKEVNDHDVLVMTPQILLNGLEKGFLNIGRICLMVLDECYRAFGSHPYAKIMKEFYHQSSQKPKIFGMAACAIPKKGISSTEELESLLDSKIFTIENSGELKDPVCSANECCIFYDPPVTSSSEMKMKLDSSWSKFDAIMLKLQDSLPSQSIDARAKYEMLRKKLSEDHASIICCLNNLGAIPAFEAAKVCLENILNDREECEYTECSSQCRYFLEEVISIFDESFPPDSVTVTMDHISPKLKLLLETIKSFGKNQVPCLIFVENIFTAKVIERFVQTITFLPHFNVSYLTRTELEGETLESFCSGKVDVLFTTDAVVEGINLPDCPSVIRFDLPRTVSSFVQSQKRASQKDLKYITMLERGNVEQRDQMFDLICSECPVTDVAISKEADAPVLKPCEMKESDVYCIEATGASVNVDSSIALINRYCQKLGDKPNFETMSLGLLHRCKLTLPEKAAFQTIIGPHSLNARLAKKRACLEACKKLHEMGALNDHLLPTGSKPPKKDPNLHGQMTQISTSGAGTTKRKELHGTTCNNALAGTWGEEEGEVKFQAYKMDFCSSDPEVQYSKFVLLLEQKLDDDVGNFEVELYLLKRNVKASVSSLGQLCLDSDQVAKAKRFQEFFFNGLFGKLFTKVSGERKLIFNKEESLWEKSYMYLLLPLDTIDPSPEPSCIDWNGIQSSFSAVEYLKKNAWLNAEMSEANRRDSLLNRNDSDTMDIDCTEPIHLANKSVHGNSVRNMVVVAIHTGRIYSILEAVTNSSAESPFEGSSDEIPSTYSSYADYFLKRYGITLAHPEQPLLLLKQSHNAHNLLEDFRNAGLSSERKSEHDSKTPSIKPQQHVHIPPELLISIDVSIDVLRSLYLLPSLMHRLHCLMLASQLRREISRHYGDSPVPSSLILAALTTQRCNESISMERLELLGDSVLKYALSCHLFLKYPDKNEGGLSDKRRWAVCNSTLHKLGISRDIQGYILDRPFIPRMWTAPGQLSIWPSPCNHGVETLQVPVDGKFFRDDEKVEIGQCCDRGHRWMVSKTISDCVEALIGAYYVGGGLDAALKAMKWIGVDVDLDLSRVNDTIKAASLRSYTPSSKGIETLESKLGYVFSVKGLLLEAITHKTKQDLGVGYSYERLEFLGDAVLDILITLYLYRNHTDVDPGELTDLRSASVNNQNFALAAVRANLHPHLEHCSGLLGSQVLAFEKSVSKSSCNADLLMGGKAPKELGDLVESIAGAILIDTKLDLGKVWEIFEPLLSPIVTPENLELPPYRELIELCSSLGYFLKQDWKRKGEAVHAELSLQLEDDLLVKEGLGQCRKDAKGQAALLLLKDLKSREISSKRNRPEIDLVAVPLAGVPLLTADSSSSPCNSNNIPEIPPISMKKGGPRTSLFNLCKTLQWPMPTIDPLETKSKSLIEFGESSERRTGFISFESRITLTIPNVGAIELLGEKQPDKKSSSDSAALAMLRELERQGKIIVCKE
ncbi:PREDICTED: endoribonuclease Dicer homolog 3 [Ipomoea nil]|uniref:endoribonuclease Dicer homolog 3 n=1 Tax=Ipomoea nil TaxID=35883 RepID=UPI000901A59F|nr:PREDICTED: endoribonuclease Dicer homolog 3 [Ipomoea nil]